MWDHCGSLGIMTYEAEKPLPQPVCCRRQAQEHTRCASDRGLASLLVYRKINKQRKYEEK